MKLYGLYRVPVSGFLPFSFARTAEAAELLPQRTIPFTVLSDPFYIFCVALFIVGYAFISWSVWRKRPRPGPLMVRFAPPSGLEAGYLRYVVNGKADKRMLLADLLQLAIGGQIQITQTMPKFFTRLKVKRIADPWNRELSTAHRALLDGMFQNGDTEVSLSRDDKEHLLSAPRFTSLLGSFYSSSSPKPKNLRRPQLFTNNGKLKVLGFILFLLLLWPVYRAAFPLFSGKASSAESGSILTALLQFVLLGLPCLIACSILAALFSVISRTVGSWRRRSRMGKIISRIYGEGVLDSFITASVSAPIFFPTRMRTPYGRCLADQAEGFELYLGSAATRRFTRYPTAPGEQMPEMSIDLFERYLPYALAFDLADTWAEAFFTFPETNYSPSWYGENQNGIWHLLESLKKAEDAFSPMRSRSFSRRWFEFFE